MTQSQTGSLDVTRLAAIVVALLVSLLTLAAQDGNNGMTSEVVWAVDVATWLFLVAALWEMLARLGQELRETLIGGIGEVVETRGDATPLELADKIFRRIAADVRHMAFRPGAFFGMGLVALFVVQLCADHTLH